MKYFFAIVSISIFILLCSWDDEYYSLNDYYSVLKIDAHTHFRGESTVLTEKAKEDNFFLLDVNVESPGGPSLPEQEKAALFQGNKFPHQVKYLSTFSLKNWNLPSWAKETVGQLRSSFEKGALGIKIWKTVGMAYKDSSGKFIMIDDPRFDSIINFVIQQDKTLLGHLGEPKNCWLPIEKMTVKNDQNYYKNHPQYHMFLHPDYPSYDQQINARDHFLEKHPGLRFVGAHLGSLEWSVDELAKRLDKFPNMAVDMAARVVHLQYQSIADYQKVRNFLIKYQDRLIYGTDIDNSTTNPESSKKYWHNTWFEDWKFFVTDEKMQSGNLDGEFKGMKLPKTVVDKIFRLNAMRWYKIEI